VVDPAQTEQGVARALEHAFLTPERHLGGGDDRGKRTRELGNAQAMAGHDQRSQGRTGVAQCGRRGGEGSNLDMPEIHLFASAFVIG
jgi:hypothetical protein